MSQVWASSLKHFPVCVAEGVDACGPCCPGSLASQFSGTFCPIEVAGEMEAGGMKGEAGLLLPRSSLPRGAGWGVVTGGCCISSALYPARLQLEPTGPGPWAPHTPAPPLVPPPLGGGSFPRWLISGLTHHSPLWLLSSPINNLGNQRPVLSTSI